MVALKNTFFFLFFALTVGSLSSCWRDILGIDCGKDITLGTLRFADSTKTFYSNWTGKETLIFKDSLGKEDTFSSKQGKTITLTKPLVIKTLCDSGWFDKQTEHYDSEEHLVDFSSQSSGYLRLSLRTDTIEQKEGFILYDLFSTSAGYANFYSVSPRAKEKPIPVKWNSWVVDDAPQFVADTTILGKNFKNVYYATSNVDKSAIFFQKTKMIIGYKLKGKTWLFDRFK